MPHKQKVLTVATTVRIPVNLVGQIMQIAETEERSFSSVVVRLLTKAVEIYPRP